jgi:acetyl esterase/lipase
MVIRPRIIGLMQKTFLLLSACAALAFAQPAPVGVRLTADYSVTPNVVYGVQNNFETHLDVYRPRNAPAPTPTLIYIHGGGWVGGSKEAALLNVMPYLEKGWAVVNVQYRLGRISLAPAAVEDCLCALRWIIRNAKQNNFDINKLVVTGHSAGGHLSLTTGMLGDTDLHRQCPGNEPLKVAAIVNWYGITNVNDLLDGVNQKSYAVQWLGSLPNREEVARRVSPIHYVRKGLPPIITIHGDADPTVPYAHGVALHEALQKTGVTHKLITVPGGKHGGFPAAEDARAFREIFAFLEAQGLR